jgi:large subunit ribosomal protein L10
MAVTKEDKQQVVAGLVADLQNASAVYLLNYEGVKVPVDTLFRKQMNNKGIAYRVTKNTLLKRALSEVGIDGLDEYLNGVTSIAIGDSEDPMAPAKELVAFLKENKEAYNPKAISLDGNVLAGDSLEDVSKMPGRKELIAQIVNIAIGPGANLVAILKGPGSKIAGAIDSIEEK